MAQRTLRGRGLAAGVGTGVAFVHRESAPSEFALTEIEEDQVEQEWGRVEAAFAEARRAVGRDVQSMPDDIASSITDVLHAHRFLLEDTALLDEMRQELAEELICAEHVVMRVLRRWGRRFHGTGDEVLSSRVDDLTDITRRVLNALVGQRRRALERLPAETVLVSQRLLPSDVVFLERRSVAAVVLELGSPASHAALMARALGIPAVGQVEDVQKQVKTGDHLLVDGASGTVTVEPDHDTMRRFADLASRETQQRAIAHTRRYQQAETEDGVQVAVVANVGTREDALLAVSNGADGIGLCRMERVYLARDTAPTADELCRELERILRPMQGRPVTVRLLDAGGDKPVPYIDSPVETDPFLGMRGVRMLLSHPSLMDVQLEALLGLSRDHDLRILVPMVTLADEMRRVREALLAKAHALGMEPLPLGAMIETPAAALCASEVAQHCDFISLGTNDLTQYVMVAGRENPSVGDYFLEQHPAVIRLLRTVCDEADDTPLEVCGELASQTDVLCTLLRMGVRTLSVVPLRVPAVKEAVRGIRLSGGESLTTAGRTHLPAYRIDRGV